MGWPLLTTSAACRPAARLSARNSAAEARFSSLAQQARALQSAWPKSALYLGFTRPNDRPRIHSPAPVERHHRPDEARDRFGLKLQPSLSSSRGGVTNMHRMGRLCSWHAWHHGRRSSRESSPPRAAASMPPAGLNFHACACLWLRTSRAGCVTLAADACRDAPATAEARRTMQHVCWNLLFVRN